MIYQQQLSKYTANNSSTMKQKIIKLACHSTLKFELFSVVLWHTEWFNHICY